MRAYQENPRLFIKRLLIQKLCIIAGAAIVGAIVGMGLIVLANVLYDMRHRLGPWVHTFGWVLMIPTLIVNSFTEDIPNAYVVNGILGAVILSAMAAVWEFVLKAFKATPDKDHENE